MSSLKAFIAGFVSTLVFHQGLLTFLHNIGRTPRTAYSMEPTGPLGVPAVISLAFWGGLWGIVLWAMIRDRPGVSYWTNAFVIGALAPSVVAFFIVFPLKGFGFAGGWDPAIIVGALFLNGAWGLGVALLMLFLDTRTTRAR